MKPLYQFFIALFLLVLLSDIQSSAQAPQKFNYQAVVRNSDGTVIEDGAVGVRISILLDSPGGTTIYSETHTTTSSLGLINLVIGDGTTTGDFSSVDWGIGSYYLKIEVE